MIQLQNPYDVSYSARDTLFLTPAKRAYINQMRFVLESYQGREPETSNLSRHLYEYIHAGETPLSHIQFAPVVKKSISPLISGRKKGESLP
jgi:hypothetical protein